MNKLIIAALLTGLYGSVSAGEVTFNADNLVDVTSPDVKFFEFSGSNYIIGTTAYLGTSGVFAAFFNDPVSSFGFSISSLNTLPFPSDPHLPGKIELTSYDSNGSPLEVASYSYHAMENVQATFAENAYIVGIEYEGETFIYDHKTGNPADGNVGSVPALYQAGSLFESVTYSIVNTTPVPEPETYAMMLAGLGLIGFMKRNKQHKHLS